MTLEYTIRAKEGLPSYWDWCCENLQVGSWKMRVGIMGTSSTYCFTNPEDLTAFKLRFNLMKDNNDKI